MCILYTNVHRNPGTGKSTVARLLGKLLFELGLRKKDVLIEVDAEKLLQMKQADVPDFIDKAMDGVLFIDEASDIYVVCSSAAVLSPVGTPTGQALSRAPLM